MASDETNAIPTGLAQFTRAAEAASNQVISAYSTSFGWATRLLGKQVRQSVKNIYALVRVADEVVDGAAAEAARLGGSVNPGQALDELEAQTYAALAAGFSANLVVHAFALTANDVGFGRELIEPFFDSMRADLSQQKHDQASFEKYVYGSAEVVGLMCLAAFIGQGGRKYSRDEKLELAAGARALGSAFQKVNFLRDLSADFKQLGRSYFPGVRIESFNDAERDRLVDDIQREISIASLALPNLPKSSRLAVTSCLMLFSALNQKIANTAASKLITTRIRVSNPAKLLIISKAIFGSRNV